LRLRFRDCTLDLETRELLRSGEPVHIEPKAMQLLESLLRARPRVLSKEELQDELWPKTFVSEHNLARLVFNLRKLIGDDGRDPTLIRTVHGFGYAFSGEATELPSRGARAHESVRSYLVWGEKEIPLRQGENILGRDPNAAVWIDRNSISRRHARILISSGTAILEDLGSKNGTHLEGRRISKPAPLKSGDEIQIGSATMVYRRSGAIATTASKVTR
jgi:DNA-binding winged helix-turn-helix (wHTH) protein